MFCCARLFNKEHLQDSSFCRSSLQFFTEEFSDLLYGDSCEFITKIPFGDSIWNLGFQLKEKVVFDSLWLVSRAGSSLVLDLEQ